LSKSSGGVARGVSRLAVEVLGGSRRLVELSLYLRSGVPVRRPTPSSILPPTFLAVPDMRSSSMVAILLVMAGAACSAPLFSQPCNVSPQGNVPTMLQMLFCLLQATK
jgi:hypothetical protein